ncbi:MAG TPA: EAL domain-containing protein, partial [Acidimicrobiales bacterium]
ASARAEATIGWVIDLIQPDALVAPALAGRSGLSLAVEHERDGFVTPVASAGDLGERDVDVATFPASADGRWTVTVSQPSDAGTRGSIQGVVVFVVGGVITLLVFALVRSIGGARDRALAMVSEKTEELAKQALHDDLTGLPNRTLLIDRTERLLARQARYGDEVAVLFLDLDNFKGVNDTLGHGAGDAYLRAVGRRLQATVRETDTVGRLGGDEFVIVLEGVSPHDGAEVVAQKVLDVLGEPIEINAVSVPVSCSVGIASGPRESADALFHDADLAMYQAKLSGKGRYVVFESGMRDAVRDQLSMGWELREAVATGGLRVIFRPVFDLRTGSPTGLEACLRWQHPTRGLLSPSVFVPVAEEAGLVPLIGRWSIREVCAHGARWSAAGRDIRVAVKLADRHLADRGLVDTVFAALEGSGFRPDLLTLEVNERALTSGGEEVADLLRGLKALGVGIAVDDFGAGHTSMGYLRRLPIDAIKLDRALVAGLADSPETQALVRMLVAMGDELDVAILAEGVAQRAQLETALGRPLAALPDSDPASTLERL